MVLCMVVRMLKQPNSNGAVPMAAPIACIFPSSSLTQFELAPHLTARSAHQLRLAALQRCTKPTLITFYISSATGSTRSTAGKPLWPGHRYQVLEARHSGDAGSLCTKPMIALAGVSDLQEALRQHLQEACWCPTMDLVAVVSADSQLSIHRLNWQRLWSISLDNPVTAMCWSPDGKVLATGSPTGRVTLYDVEKCELVKQGPACPHVSHSISHLCWVDSLPGAPQSTYSQMCQLRHMRLLSRPGTAPPPGTHLPLTTQPEVIEWPATPQVLGVLLASNDQGDVSVLAGGTFLLAHITPGSHNQKQSRDDAVEDDDTAINQLQVQSSVTRDLQHVLHTWSSTSALHAQLLHAPHLAARPQVVLQVAVLCNHLQDMMHEAGASVTKAGQQWSAAYKELSRKLDGLRDSLAEHMGPAGQAQPDGLGLDGEAEPDILGELACMLAAGHVSPGMLSWLSGSLREHGIRRLAQQLDAAINTAFSLILHEVCPRLEVVVFILGELRGLAHPLLQAAEPLGLQVDMCRQAELVAVQCVMQCEMLKGQLTKQGSQYRALFTWLLKTVLLQENGGSAAATAAALMGPAAAITAGGPTAIAAAAGSLSYDVSLVVELLEGGLLLDPISPDLCDGWFDPDVTPASLIPDPVISMDHVKRLMSTCPAAPYDITPQKRQQQGQQPHADTQQQCDQDAEQMCDQGGSTWPSKPLKKQIKSLDDLVKQLTASIPAATSPKFVPAPQVTLLPLLGNDGGDEQDSSSRAGSYVRPRWLTCTRAHPTHPAPTPEHQTGDNPGQETSETVDKSEKLYVVTHVPRAHMSKVSPGQQEALLYCSMCQGGDLALQVHAQLVVLPSQAQVIELAPYKDGQAALFVWQQQWEASGSAEGSAGGMHLVLLPEPPQLQGMSTDWAAHGSVLQACVAAGAVHHLDSLTGTDASRSRPITGAHQSTSGAAPAALAQHVAGAAGAAGAAGWKTLAVSDTRGVALLLPHKTLIQVYDLEDNEEEEGQEEEEEEEEGQGGDDVDQDMVAADEWAG